jgi:hypothetical protein
MLLRSKDRSVKFPMQEHEPKNVQPRQDELLNKQSLTTRCNDNGFIDLQDQLNMFRANFCLSSGAQDLHFLQHIV